MAAAATGRAEEWHQGEKGGWARFACLACLAWARRAVGCGKQAGEGSGGPALLGFLADDYKPHCAYWEAVEMGRKLLLSVVASFWSTKSTMCVATAFLISATFLVLHCLSGGARLGGRD